MKTTKLVLLVIVSIVMVILVVQNTAPVQARFLWIEAEVSAILLLFLTAAFAFVSGLLVALLVKRSPKKKA